MEYTIGMGSAILAIMCFVWLIIKYLRGDKTMPFEGLYKKALKFFEAAKIFVENLINNT